MNEKNHYWAWVSNDSGASNGLTPHDSSAKRLCDYIRRTYGKGWTAHIMRVEINGESTEIKKFRIRK